MQADGLIFPLKHPVPKKDAVIYGVSRDVDAKWEIDRTEITLGSKLGSGQFVARQKTTNKQTNKQTNKKTNKQTQKKKAQPINSKKKRTVKPLKKSTNATDLYLFSGLG